MTVLTDEMTQMGLLEGASEPHLTQKGREWLRGLEDVETREAVDASEAAEDLVCSTNGLFR